MKLGGNKKLATALPLLLFLFSTLALPAQALAGSTETEDGRFEFLAGYGKTFRGTGKTRIDLETAGLVLRYEHMLTDKLEEGELWEGRHALLVELPVDFMVDPWDSPMIGINFLASWYFTGFPPPYVPYVFAGGGLLYTNARLDGMGSRINGNYQGGGGLRLELDRGYDLIFEYRFHHVSNADTRSPNKPLNSNRLFLGISLPR